MDISDWRKKSTTSTANCGAANERAAAVVEIGRLKRDRDCPFTSRTARAK